MSFIIAGATIGAAVIGGGAAIYGANKSSKAAKQAANRTAKAADDANRVETMYKMMGQGAQGINPFSTEGDLQDFFDTGGAGGKAVGPSTGAMPLYADKFTGVENFEGKEFGKMVDEYNRSQEFWDAFRGQQEKRMEQVQQIPAVREALAERQFAELGKITAAQAEEQAQLQEAMGQAQSAQIAQQLGANNNMTMQNAFRGFGGVGGGGAMQNALMNNALNAGAQSAAAELQGQSNAAKLRGQAELANNPFASGLYQDIMDQKVKDFSLADRYANNFLTQGYAPQTAFMNATKPFSPGRITAPDQMIPTFQGTNDGAGWSAVGNSLMGLSGNLLSNKLQMDAMAKMMPQAPAATVAPGYGTVMAPPSGGFPAADPFAGTWAGSTFGGG